MEGGFYNDKSNEADEPRPDRSVLYMGIILGFLILVMTYLALFTDDPWSIFGKKADTVTLNSEQLLINESETMSDEEVRQSLIKFIEAFYYDQRKGYFDPPSYFAPITKTFYNFHNLTYQRLKDLYWKRLEDIKRLDRSWMPSTLVFARTDSGIVANYWARERYFRPSVRQEQSMDIRYELIIDESGKIFSLKEAEIRNFQTYIVTDTTKLTHPFSPATNTGTPDNTTKERVYDASVVDVVPQFPGGPASLWKFIETNLRYPAAARDKKVAGSVYVSFFVEKDGTLRNIELRQGLGSGCDEEALRLVRSFPAWVPGMVAGNPVSTFYILPVPFQAQ